MQDIPNSAVRALPHRLEPELLHPRLVGCDSRTLDPHLTIGYSMGCVDGDLVIGEVAILHAEVVVVDICF